MKLTKENIRVYLSCIVLDKFRIDSKDLSNVLTGAEITWIQISRETFLSEE